MTSGPIGIFGGTFNPIHNGHLRSALELKQCLGLDQVRLVPAARPPLRDAPELSPDLRADLVEQAVASEPGLVCDRRELSRQGPSYTIDTLGEMRTELGPARPLCLIVGTDILERLDAWHRWQELLDYAHLVVMARPGWQAPDCGEIAGWLAGHSGQVDDIHAAPAGRVVMQRLRQLPISATEIRGMIAAGQSPRYLLPDTVWDTIQRLGAYGAGVECAESPQQEQHGIC